MPPKGGLPAEEEAQLYQQQLLRITKVCVRGGGWWHLCQQQLLRITKVCVCVGGGG